MDVKPRARTFALLILVVASAWMLAALQADVTNTSGFSMNLVRDYADGTIGDSWTDGVPSIIWKARVLVRGLILGLVAATAGHLSVEGANLIVQAAFIAAALVVIYRSTSTFAAPGGALFASALAVAFVPWGFLSVGYRISYPYDFPALFFSAAGLAAILSRRFALLVAAIVFGTLNKETTVFLLPAYFLAEWPAETRRTLLLRTSILSVAFGIAYEVPRVLLQSAQPMLVTVYAKGAEGVGTRVWPNLNHLLHGDPGGFIQGVWCVALLHVPPLVFFRRLSWPLKAAYFAAPVFLVPLFFFGNVFELRLYNELIPLGAMGCAAVLVGLPDAENNLKPWPQHRKTR